MNFHSFSVSTQSSPSSFPSRILTNILYLIFFLSGVAALIYQVTWQRLLTVHYGVGALSITLIVSIYMLGLGLGALWGGRAAERQKDTGLFYFWVELGIGLFGLLSFPLIMAVGKLTAGSPYALAVVYKTAILLVPTILMGMSLPILIKIFSGLIADLTNSLSKLYCVNTLGAASGALLASYGLISFWGIDIAIYAAAGINLALAAMILLLIKMIPRPTFEADRDEKPADSLGGMAAQFAPVFIFITGFLAIGYELVWFRFIGVLVKSSPYAFATILAVYLLGIGLGSWLIGGVIRVMSPQRRISLFFFLQAALASVIVATFIGYYYLTTRTGAGFWTQLSFGQVLHPPVHMLQYQHHFSSVREYVTFLFQMGSVLIWPMIFMLIPTLIMGATFPLIMDMVYRNKDGAAWATGRIYFFNILGNVLGGAVTGYALLPGIGTERTIVLFVLIGLALGLPLVITGRRIYWSRTALILTIGGAAWLLFPAPGGLYEAVHPRKEGFRNYFREGIDGVVMTSVNDEGVVENYIQGDSHGGRPGHAFYVQVVEAAALVPGPQKILVVGYGTGSITEAALKIPGVQKVRVVELNQTLLKNLRKIPLFVDLMSDPRLEFVVDDGRRYLRAGAEKYDMVFMSPLRATTAYSTNIYSKQFFELVSARMNPGAVFVAWTNSPDATFRTLDSVFADTIYHRGPHDGFFISSNAPISVRDTGSAIAVVSAFPPGDRGNIIRTSQMNRSLSRDALRGIVNPLPPVQDWRPYSEYFIGTWFRMRNGSD